MLRIDINARVGEFHLQPAFEAADELVVLFGPSGCGKSLTLQAVAGLLTDARRQSRPPGTQRRDESQKLEGNANLWRND